LTATTRTRSGTRKSGSPKSAEKIYQNMKNIFQVRPQLVLLISSLSVFICGCATRLPHTVKVERDLEFAQTDGQSLRLDLYSPKKSAGKLPVVVWIHGGSWKSGSKDYCPIGFMAAKNLAVVSMDYRLDNVALFPAQLHDCKGTIRWLRANADRFNLDADHIGIFGASAGGHLGLLLATTADAPELEGDVGGNLGFSSRVQCVCAFYPPTDLNRLVTDPQTRKNPLGDVAKLIGGAVADNVGRANFASPVFHVDKNCAPVFLMHGGTDELVPPEQSEIFYRALQKAGVESQMEIVSGKGHGIIAPPVVAEKIYSFFNRHLKNER
jgi:acetyl esterase/lipase